MLSLEGRCPQDPVVPLGSGSPLCNGSQLQWGPIPDGPPHTGFISKP